MNSPDWGAEISRFLALPPIGQAQWLAGLMLALTIFARVTYTTGSNGLDDPPKLRSFNELLHRVADQLCNKLAGVQRRPDDVFAKLVTEALKELAIQPADLFHYLQPK
jgi:hypothetical protein